MLAENDLKLEVGRLAPSDSTTTLIPHHWWPPPKDCLKLNVDATFKDGTTAIPVLARDDGGQVRGLWFEKKTFSSAIVAEANALFNACVIAKNQPYVKILIESDCKIVMDVVLSLGCRCFSRRH